MTTPRRAFLAAGLAAAPALYLPPRLFAAGADDPPAPTPQQTEGPFYPDRLPLDTDNDLLRLNDAGALAAGTVAHLSGRVLSAAGEPVRGATVEIWQADANGNYLHTRGGRDASRDKGFQGFGRFLTDAAGRYYFRTIEPVPYGPRTPHIHIAVDRGGSRQLTTQCYVAGHPGNARDGVLRGTPADQRDRLMAEFTPLPNTGGAKELAATFDLVLGEAARGGTPADPDAENPGEASRPSGRRFGRGVGPGLGVGRRDATDRALDALLGPG